MPYASSLRRLLTLSLLTPVGVSGQAPDTVTLNPVVVTATRVPASVDAVAATVTVLTGRELELRGIRTVVEALRAVPGAAVVETGSFGGQTALFLRGGESDYVKVLVDGVPWNQPGGAFDFADLTTDNVDRIEIVRGPASVLYGSDAMTGVIQVFTRTGSGAPRVTGAARAGTYGSAEYEAGLVGGGPRAGYSVTVSRSRSDGLYPFNNEYRNTVVSGRFRVAPDARTDASLAYRWGGNTYHFPTDGTGQPVDSNQFSADRGPSLSVDVGRRLGAGIEVRGVAALRELRLRSENRPDSPGEPGSESRDFVRRASGGALAIWRRAGTTVTAGIDYEDERQTGRSVFTVSSGTSFPDSINVLRWNTGYYAQALFAGARPLSLTLGGRLDDNSQFGAHGTFRAGVSYRINAATRLRATVGTGFKEPTFFENFARGSVRGNPNLDPERSTSWEAGLERAWGGGRVRVALTYFDQRFRDLIEFTFTPAPPDTVNYFNVVGASARGVEASAELQLARGVVGALAYTYLRTRVDNPGFDSSPDGLFVAGQPLLRRPAHTVTPQIAAALGARGHVVLAARLVGGRDDLDFSRPPGERRVSLRSYARVNLAGQYTLLGHDGAGRFVVLTAQIDNLSNDHASEIAGFLPRGRTILVGVRMGVGGRE
jgi:vitamin B12 transporter